MKGNKKLKFYKTISNHYDEVKYKKFQFEQYLFAKNAQSNSKIYHQVILLLKFSQTKTQVKYTNNKYYDLNYTMIKNRDENEIVTDKLENNENVYNNFNDFITPNFYIEFKNNNEILR